MARLLSRVGIDRLALGVVVVCCGTAAGAAPAGRTLMRYPTLHGGTIVFVAHDNLWSVPRSGGTASRLTAGEGRDVMPRFSPDGRWIAFTGEYQGNRDVYVMPAGGGAAQRLTFTSDVVSDAPLRWGPNNMVMAVLIFELQDSGLYPQVAALAVLMVIGMAVMVTILRRLGRSNAEV